MQSPGDKRLRPAAKAHDTSWGGVAEWYASHLSQGETYHSEVVMPHVKRIVGATSGMRILDLACGEGSLVRELAASGADVTGSDVAPELIALAKKKGGSFHIADAGSLAFADDASYDVVVCVLAIQNMERPEKAIAEAARVLRPGGRLVLVLNHPVLRIPKRSSWGFDAANNVQFRRLDGYYLPSKEKMLAHPGQGESGGHTWSFQRPLDAYMKLLFNRGFAVVGFEEWLSHKTSEKGPRKAAEDRARKEFPMFLMIEARLADDSRT